MCVAGGCTPLDRHGLRPPSRSHPTPTPTSAQLCTRLPVCGGGAGTYSPVVATARQHTPSTECVLVSRREVIPDDDTGGKGMVKGVRRGVFGLVA